MLVLSRKRDERIIIGKDVVIQILDIRGNQVRIGITAPKEIPVVREEKPQETKNLARWKIVSRKNPPSTANVGTIGHKEIS